MEENKSSRINSFDALRALAMVLGVIIHGTLSYVTNKNIGWGGKDSAVLFGMDELSWVLHQFRIPLFFLMAGYFSVLLYEKVGIKDFFKHRLVRVVIPFCVGFIFSNTIYRFIYGCSIFNPAWKRPLSYCGNYLFNTDIHLGHLWFLYYLLFFYIILIVARRFLGKFTVGPKVEFIICHSWLKFFLLSVPTTAIFMFMKLWGTPSHTFSFILNPESFIYYFIFFSYGIFLRDLNIDPTFLKKNWWVYILIATGLAVLSLYLFKYEFSYHLEHYIWIKVGVVYLVSLFKWFMLFGLIGFAATFLSCERSPQRYLSDSAYWIYLIHPPFVIVLQNLLSVTTTPAVIKFLIVTIVPLIIAISTYELFVRYSFIGAILHGRKYRKIRI